MLEAGSKKDLSIVVGDHVAFLDGENWDPHQTVPELIPLQYGAQ